MDESKMAFLQSVLRYSTSHTEATAAEAIQPQQNAENQQQTREMSPEVIFKIFIH
jgi:hypothetical protein